MTNSSLAPFAILDRWAVSLAEVVSAATGDTVSVKAVGDQIFGADGLPVRSPLETKPGQVLLYELDPEHVVFVELTIPPGAEAHADGIVSSKLPQISPWNVADILFGYTVSRQDDTGSWLLIAIVDQADIPPIAFSGQKAPITYFVQTGNGTRVDFRQNSSSGASVSSRRVRAIKAAIIALGLTLVATTVAGPFLTYAADREIAQIDKRQEELRAKLEGQGTGSGSQTDPAARLGALINAQPSRFAIVNALAHLLPDTVHLETLNIEGPSLGFTAVADDAAMVLRLLADTPVFRNAAFSGPTVKEEDGSLVRLEISAQIGSDEEAATALEKLLVLAKE